MGKKDTCSYTTMLNRIKILDEQICEMQNTLKSVKDIMRKNFEERLIDADTNEADADQIRATSLETMREDSQGEDK